MQRVQECLSDNQENFISWLPTMAVSVGVGMSVVMGAQMCRGGGGGGSAAFLLQGLGFRLRGDPGWSWFWVKPTQVQHTQHVPSGPAETAAAYPGFPPTDPG